MANEGLEALTYAVRPAVVARYLGELSLVLAAVAIAPALVGVWFAEYDIASRYLAVALILAGMGGLLTRLPAPARIQTNEALVVTAAAYLLASAVMAYPMTSAGLAWTDAVFESVSGITTTGLSMIADVASLPRTLVFVRSWLQWCGGLGIVVLSIALLMGNDVAARRLIDPVPTGEHLATTTRAFARRVAGTYVTLTLLAVAALAALGLGAFDAVNHALAGISTGGFSPHAQSLAAIEGWPARTAITTIGLVGAISLPLVGALARREWQRVLGDTELRALLVMTALICGALALLGLVIDGSASVADRLLLGVSAQSTTGFAAAPPGELDAASKLVLMVAMATGGSVGSTAGGIKLLRLLVLVGLLGLLLRRAAMPSRAVAQLSVHGRPVSGDQALAMLAVVMLFPIAALVSWLPFLAAGLDPLDSLFDVVSALGTVGLSTGVTSPHLAPALKAVLGIDMLLGRVEFFAVLVLIYPATWFARRHTEQ
ncbi:MAG: TrkH family potassium uptake protein [Betaproteobacteria bacterium]|nr:TrkH family potassium uptake protein [Betaproteobacteria bacterium]